MAETFVTLDTTALRRNLVRLNDREVGIAMARALSRTALDVREAEQAHIEATFPEASSSGGRFIAGFRAIGAKPDNLIAYVTPRGTSPTGAPSKSEKILSQHREGVTFTANGEVKRLSARGKLAIPASVKRGSRGRVRKSSSPDELLDPEGRGFVLKTASGEGLFVRTGRGKRSAVKLAFTLEPSADLDASVEFYRVAERTTTAVFAAKAKREFERIRFPGI